MSQPDNLYRSLDAAKVIETAALLRQRVEERFPGAGLAKVCRELETLALENERRCEWIGRPNVWLRVAAGVVIAVILVVLAGAVTTLAGAARMPRGLVDILQGSEAALNEIALIGAAIFFLITAETRIKRSRALKALHELRAVAHVIDMHQLTKDPERVLRRGPATASSPTHALTPFELSRYLDYCSEMLSIVGKVAALYAARLNDPVVLGAVTEIEEITTSLSTKIWQKITILQNLETG